MTLRKTGRSEGKRVDGWLGGVSGRARWPARKAGTRRKKEQKERKKAHQSL